MIINKEDILAQQKKMSPGFYVVALILMMAVQWMTLDMYLPALPVLKEQFSASEAVLNLSLNSDLGLCAIGTLIGGTLSDKYGRKPVMLFGLIMTIVTMLCAAASPGIIFLIVMRGLTGLGGGFALAVAMAMASDSFKGSTFRKVTTMSQAAAIVGPVFAPAIGAFLIEFLSWRWIFIVLGAATLITTIPFFFMTETWPKEKRTVTSVWQATVQSFNVARNGSFISMMLLMMLLSIPMWAYLSVCSYVYYDFFNVSNMRYSVLYAIGTLFSFIAPFIYIWLSSRMKGRFIIDIIMILIGLAAGLLLFIADAGPVAFLVAVIPILMAEAMIRPMSIVIVLEEHPDEAGSASAVAGFAGMVVALPSTALATIQWSSFITGMGVITAGCLIIGVALWLGMIKKKVYAGQLGIH